MIAAVVQQRELFASMLRREVRQRYKGSVLGILWSLVTPLVMMGAYTLVFSLIFTTVPFAHYPAFLLTGLSVWVFFAGGLEAGTASIVASANLVKKVAFERSIVPLATTMSHLVTFGAMIAVLVPLNLVLQPGTRTTMILLPALIVCLVVMTAGLALALSALNVYFRDVQHILGILLLAWYFLTPVLFSVSVLDDRPEQLRLLYLNPMTAVIVSYQRALLDGLPPQWDALAYSAGVAIVLFIVGFWYFDRSKDDFESAL